MSEMTRSGGGRVPQACTLPTTDQPLRLAEFDDLFTPGALGVDRVAPVGVRLALRPEAAVAAQAADLALRETRCCSFFTFTLTATGGELSMEVSVRAAYVEVLAALAERAANRAEPGAAA